MRTLAIVTASTLLAGAAIVVPVVSVGAAPHAVKPSLERVPMPAAHAAAPIATVDAAGAASGGVPGAAAESVLTRDTDGADVVGVAFPDRATADGVTVTVRSRDHGRWGSWTEVGLSDSAPDSGYRRGRARQARDRARGRRRVRRRSRSG